MNKNIIFLGRNGQIANAFFEYYKSKKTQSLDNFNCKFYSSNDVDLGDLDAVKNFLKTLPSNIDMIVNCMGYTNVDKAEEEQELCDKINHRSVAIIADYCFNNHIKLIHFSTDYVFDGSGDEPFSEDNTKNLNPINFYGKTKLWAEQAIQKSGCDYVIIRISWIYDNRETSHNFVNTIKKLAKEKEFLNIVNDQIGSPTSADFVARNCFKIFDEALSGDKTSQQKFQRRILHLNNGKFMSWYDFACQIIAELKQNNAHLMIKKVLAIPSSQYKTKTPRPSNCRLKSKIHW